MTSPFRKSPINGDACVIKVMPKVGRHRNRLVDLYRYHSFSSAPRGGAVLFRLAETAFAARLPQDSHSL